LVNLSASHIPQGPEVAMAALAQQIVNDVTKLNGCDSVEQILGSILRQEVTLTHLAVELQNIRKMQEQGQEYQ
jgi:hypothetical protein